MKRVLASTSICIAALTAPAHAFDITAMNDAERAALQEEIRAYIMANPQVILDSVNQMEAQQQEQQAVDDLALVAANAEALFEDGFSWVGGNPEGDVTVVEFLDYRCGYCRKAHDEVAELLSSDGNIRLIVKELPILGEASTLSSRFAIAAKQVAGNDAYKAVHDALMAYGGQPTAAAFGRLAESLGLDGAAIVAQMGSDDVTKEIDDTRALAQRLAIRGTPTFVMGGQLVRGYVPIDAMKQIVNEARG